MSTSSIIISALNAIILGGVVGFIFTQLMQDGRAYTRRNMVLGVLAALFGWGFGMAIPIRQYHLIGADFLALGFSGLFLHVYAVTFHGRSNLMKDFDSQSPHHTRDEGWRPKIK